MGLFFKMLFINFLLFKNLPTCKICRLKLSVVTLPYVGLSWLLCYPRVIIVIQLVMLDREITINISSHMIYSISSCYVIRC